MNPQVRRNMVNAIGWAEIHPPDWIQRVPCRGPQKASILVTLLGSESLTARFAARPLEPRNALTDTLAVREIVDGWFTTVLARATVTRTTESATVNVSVGGPQEHDKATWLAWWHPVVH